MVEPTNTTASQDSKVNGTGLNDNEFRVYDRQLRLWGFEAQQKMKNSLVLLCNLTPTCTELARHLVLSGINIWLMQDSGVMVGEDDVESDFLCSAADMGTKRGEAVKNKLAEMNPFVEIEFHETTPLAQIVDQASQKGRSISVVIQGFDSWSNAAKLNAEVRQAAPTAAFYSVSASGLYGFAFADLGPAFSYQFAVKEAETESMKTTTVTDSATLETFLAAFADPEQKLTWRRRGKQPGKMLLAAFLAQYLKEKTPSADDSKRLVQELLKAKGHSAFAGQEAFDFVCSEVSRMYGLAFNPCSSVIGSVLSQEVIKVVTQRDHPGHGLFVYDSLHQSLTLERAN